MRFQNFFTSTAEFYTDVFHKIQRYIVLQYDKYTADRLDLHHFNETICI